MSLKPAACAATVLPLLSAPAGGHDIYSHLVDGRGNSCCDDRDCRPAPYRFVTGRLQMLVDRRWIDVSFEAVQYRTLAGDSGETRGGHWCGFADEPTGKSADALYVTRCAFLPPGAAGRHGIPVARASLRAGLRQAPSPEGPAH